MVKSTLSLPLSLKERCSTFHRSSRHVFIHSVGSSLNSDSSDEVYNGGLQENGFGSKNKLQKIMKQPTSWQCVSWMTSWWTASDPQCLYDVMVNSIRSTTSLWHHDEQRQIHNVFMMSWWTASDPQRLYDVSLWCCTKYHDFIKMTT